MSKMDFSRTSARDRIKRNGSDCISDDGIPRGQLAPKSRQSKSDLRAELQQATAKITRIVKCGGCGHSSSVALPPSKLHARLRCSKCSEVAQ